MREFRWQYVARWIWIAFLAVAAWVAVRRGYLETARPLYAVCAAMAAYNLSLSLFLHRLSAERVIIGALLLDVVALTVYLHYSGDIENPIYGAYVLPVVAAAVIRSRRAGYLLAVCSTLLFSLLWAATAIDEFPGHRYVPHHHLALLNDLKQREYNFHNITDPDLNPHAQDYVFTCFLWLTILLFGSAYGFGSLSERIREKERLQARMTHQAKMADIGLLAAGIAHEIGNPLSSMSALVQLLKRKESSPEVADRLRALGSHIERIHKIVEEVTTFARPSAGQRTRVPVGGVIEKALSIFRFHERSKQVRLDVLAEKGPLVEVVEDQLVQVVLNLLLNAADASPTNGTVTVRIEEEEGEARIAISDTGAGMGSEAISHLFTPFYTTKDPGRGVGLGLFMSDTIVRAHQGRIDVRSREGEGSTFVVCLPLAAVPAGVQA